MDWFAARWHDALALADWAYQRAGITDSATVLMLVLLAAAGVLVLVLYRRMPEAAADVPSLSGLTQGSRLFATAVLFLFFGVFGAWAVMAPLTSAAIAEGVVSPDGARRSVQHLEGGIISRLHVRDGDRVDAGDRLVTLERIQAQADHAVMHERFIHLSMSVARLEAEQLMAPGVELPAAFRTVEATPEVGKIIAAELALFSDRMSAIDGQRKILAQRILQLNAENKGLHEAIAGQDEQIRYLDQEIGNVQTLFDKGLEKMPRLLALKRERAGVQIARAQNRALIARNLQSVGETELEIGNLDQQWRERAGKELATSRTELAQIASRLPQTSDALKRTEIVAPVSGTIVELAFTTPGGVVRPGERILDIVPDSDDLLIDARVRPQDIDEVRSGLEAKVVLTAFAQRNLPTVMGIVRDVSADRIIDSRTNEPYYLARISVRKDQLVRAGVLQLMAGMPAEVMIRTGERTFFDYLTAPVLQSFDRTFRES